MRLALPFAILAVVFAGPAASQSSDPAWLDDLNLQIEGDKQCKVSYLIKVHEGQLGGRTTYEARVQCEDGRMFDATRIGEGEPFVFKACEIQVC